MASYQNWAVNFHKESYIDVLEKDKLVYLTADSEETIDELNPDDIYIIGGIVDRNRYVNLTFDKAKEQGIRHGRLPITEHVKLTTSAVLTVNQIFEIFVK